MNILCMHSNSRGMNKAAVSQPGVSQMTNSDMRGDQREKAWEKDRERDWERGMSWGAASALQTGAVEAAQVPQPPNLQDRIPNLFTTAKSFTRGDSVCVCMCIEMRVWAKMIVKRTQGVKFTVMRFLLLFNHTKLSVIARYVLYVLEEVFALWKTGCCLVQPLETGEKHKTISKNQQSNKTSQT